MILRSVQCLLLLHEEGAREMSINLRDRRRQQTAKDIQLAALRLSLSLGYPAVTTDSIAVEAGISPRTFFNYYPNKQAAVLGEPPSLDCDCAAWIVTSTAPLRSDLARLLGSMLEQKQLDRQIVRMIEQIWDSAPELMTIFRNSMDNIALAIGRLLEARLGPGRQQEAMLVAELATHALSNAVRAWAADETMRVADIPPLIERQMAEVGGLVI
ncbi:TetR family transcriptional regulator [Paracoccus liaowanqingii]|uniref:TetR family transcriptional regulator n=2 Tax=Paracoccus liaowanqingii TaxID=2560053 RepID=A0A4P7HM86_9RHOB|nr:TetR family transcriptional regulator [Paracoccus liaowanqingii]